MSTDRVDPARARVATAATVGSAAFLRRGVERSMAATLAVVAAMLVALAVPGFSEDHRPGATPLVVLSAVLAGAMVAALPLALVQRPGALRVGLRVPVAAYVGLLVIEPLQPHDPLPAGTIPWLVGLSLVAFSCTAVVEVDPVRAGLVCAGIDTALTAVYAGRFPLAHDVVEFVGLALLAAALIAGVRVLRSRADRADVAERRARARFEDHQRRVATEAERVRTDALLHDTVLAALLTAAGDHAPERATGMARSALQILSELVDRPDTTPTVVRFGAVLSSSAPALARFRDSVRIDLRAVEGVAVPPAVADAFVSATVQALTNSVDHAGPSAHRTLVATRIGDAGVRVTVDDDGIGFDPEGVGPERLGVRVSVRERMHGVGASASITSTIGRGTTVVLDWDPSGGAEPVTRRPGESLLALIPRQWLSRSLGVVIVAAVLVATVEAVLVTHAYASVIASVLGLFILPALVRGARRGTTSNLTAWGTTAVSCVLCCIATIGLDPATFDYVSVSRYTCGVLAGAVMGWMAGRRLPPVIAVAVLLVQIAVWAGPAGVIRLGLAGEVVLVIAALLMHHAIRRVTAAALVAADQHRDLTTAQSEFDAFHLERRRRLGHASRTATPMLTHIVEHRGVLDEDARARCRVLEQSLRDEIRGRRLLNDAVRGLVAAHRRRGAIVQVLDDGGLDDTAPDAVDAVLDDVARHLESIRSSRIVVRTGPDDSDVAVTIVASTPDETAVALGIDADDGVDLWVGIPRPGAGLAADPDHAAAGPDHAAAGPDRAAASRDPAASPIAVDAEEVPVGRGS